MKQLVFLLFSWSFVQVSFAQNPPGIIAPRSLKGNGHITGVALDSLTQKRVELANVAMVDPSTN